MVYTRCESEKEAMSLSGPSSTLSFALTRRSCYRIKRRMCARQLLFSSIREAVLGIESERKDYLVYFEINKS